MYSCILEKKKICCFWSYRYFIDVSMVIIFYSRGEIDLYVVTRKFSALLWQSIRWHANYNNHANVCENHTVRICNKCYVHESGIKFDAISVYN